MNLLIETCTERSSIGLYRDHEGLLFSREFPLGLNNAKYLAVAIQEGLEAALMSAKDLSSIAVGIGPGSYTGIRVGAMMAKALSFATKVPLVGVCTLMTFLPKSDGPFAVLIDAKISGAYVIFGHKENHQVIYTSEPKAISLDFLIDPLKKIKTIVSPQMMRLRNQLAAFCPHVEWEECYPNLLQMADKAHEALEKSESSIDGSLKLLYLRKTQAEIERDSKIGEL